MSDCLAILLPYLVCRFWSRIFPNPFNSTTVIRYELSADLNVSLKLYDVLRKEVMTQVDEPQTSGYHQVTVEGSRLANGVYFYRIIVGSFVDTKKILLVE